MERTAIKMKQILTLFSFILLSTVFSMTPSPAKKNKPSGMTRNITVSEDFSIKHIRQGNCNQNSVLVNGMSENIKNNLNRTASEWEYFKYTSRKKESYRQKNTFIMTDHKTVTEIENCLATIADDKFNSWTRRRFKNSYQWDLTIYTNDFGKCSPSFNVKQMYLAVITELNWNLNGDISFSCNCFSGNFTFNISLVKTDRSYTINHYASQKTDGKGSICH